MGNVSAWLRKNGVANRDALRFITSIKYDASLVKALNNMTFLYDNNWQSNGKTLPLAFFYIKDFSEMRASEVSQKTLLFYNSSKSGSDDSVKGGLLGVVADNIVNKPVKYKLDVVIPASFTMIDKTWQFSITGRNMMLLEQVKNLDEESAIPALISTALPLGTNSAMLILKALITALTIEDSISTNIITQMLTLDTANKESLSAMWGNRTILKLKLPNGWKFKYVAIENMNINKKGEDGNYFTGTIEVTEVPIMTADRSRTLIQSPSSLSRLQKSASQIGGFLDKMENTFGQE